MTKSLSMSFLTEQGKKASLRVDAIREDLTKEEVSAVMDAIIEKNIFENSSGDLKIKDSAQILERNTEVLQVK